MSKPSRKIIRRFWSDWDRVAQFERLEATPRIAPYAGDGFISMYEEVTRIRDELARAGIRKDLPRERAFRRVLGVYQVMNSYGMDASRMSIAELAELAGYRRSTVWSVHEWLSDSVEYKGERVAQGLGVIETTPRAAPGYIEIVTPAEYERRERENTAAKQQREASYRRRAFGIARTALRGLTAIGLALFGALGSLIQFKRTERRKNYPRATGRWQKRKTAAAAAMLSAIGARGAPADPSEDDSQTTELGRESVAAIIDALA